MGYRIVKINKRCKLETSMEYLVYRAEEEYRILLDEISVLIIENQQVCITAALMSKLMDHKVRVVFCNDAHMPQGEVEPYAGCYDTPNKIKIQLNWNPIVCDEVWSKIIKYKIHNQAQVLKLKGDEKAFNLLKDYEYDIHRGDSTNREGLAAKSYFFSLFGLDFERRKESDIRNIYLNYGYSLLLSLVSKEIASFGYLNAFGIHHIGTTNHYNLACDFVEPLRPFVDIMLVRNELTPDNFKRQFMNMLTSEVRIDDKNMLLNNAVRDYVLSILTALKTEDSNLILQITFKDGTI